MGARVTTSPTFSQPNIVSNLGNGLGTGLGDRFGVSRRSAGRAGHSDAGRALRRFGHGRLGEARPDGRGGVRGGVVPDPGRDSREPDVMGPGAYRFGDYWKLGLPLLGLFGSVAVLLVTVLWSF